MACNCDNNERVVKVVKSEGVNLPIYETEGAAGLDFKADITEPIILKPGKRILIPTGLKVEIPDGFEIQVRPKSGLALKKGITVLNTPGTIDAKKEIIL